MKNRIKPQPHQFVLKPNSTNLKFLDYPHLKVLNLSNMQLKTLDINLPNLEILNLDINNLTQLDICKQFPELYSLSISNNFLTYLTIPKSLKILNIRNNFLTYISIENLEIFDIRENLIQTIDINQNNQLTSFQIGWLKALVEFESFELLVLLQFKQTQINFNNFIIKAIDKLKEHGYVKNCFIEYFDKNILLKCIQQNQLFYFKQLLPFYKENKEYFDQQETPLFFAIKNSKIEFVLLLMNNINCINEIDAFHEAIKQGQTSLVKEFIDYGIDCNAYNCKGYTPLTTALLNITQINMETIIQLLLLARSNPNQLNKNGYTLLQMCIIKSNVTAIKFIIQFNKNKRKSIFEKFKMNLKNKYGSYPLHISIQCITILQLLIENNIGSCFDINYENITPKQISYDYQKIIVSKLLQKQEKIEIQKLFINSSNIKYPILSKSQNTQRNESDDSSCPEISDNDIEIPNKPKINKKYLTQQDDISDYLIKLSEDEECQLNCSYESEIQSIKQNLNSLKLEQLNHQNKILYNNKDQHPKYNSIIINQLNKKRLNIEQFNFFIRKEQYKLNDRTKSLSNLRKELHYFNQVKQLKDLLIYEKSNYDQHIKIIKEQIDILETEYENEEIKQYLKFQQIQLLQ